MCNPLPYKPLHVAVAQVLRSKKLYMAPVMRTHERIQKADNKGEIGSINRVFYDSLRARYSTRLHITQTQLELLDIANILTWIAFTLYDDILDNGHDDLAPYAQNIERCAARYYAQAGVDASFCARYFAIVHEANKSELRARAAPHLVEAEDLRTLVGRKSIAHCIGQLWIARIAAPEVNYEHIEEGCLRYCEARQMSDDLYDWREDFQKGHITYVTHVLTKHTSLPTPSLQDLNLTFWHTGLESICQEIVDSTMECAERLRPILKNNAPYLTRYTYAFRDAATQSLHTHAARKLKFSLDH